ncbi:UNVERIFIED_CONTAM: hypothetical protein GTU68_045785 [Idotea baltica]|nr:hypothetical protein [Idotea baltica]
MISGLPILARLAVKFLPRI